MMKSFPQLAAGALAAVVLLSSGPSAQAGLIPWTYNAIFGPVGSTFAPRGSYYRGAYYGGYAPAAVGGACNTCNYGAGYGYTSNYYSGYAPVYGSSYGVSGMSYGNGCGCSPCATGNCVGGCATGNCSSYSPATGTTSVPTPANPTPTPTQTFQSSKPTVNPEANGNNGSRSTYDEDGFQQPKRSEENGGSGNNDSSDNSDAPSFNPFGSNTNESMKIPSAPTVPVEKRKPAPTELESNGLKLPSLRFQPAPVAVDETNVSFRTPTRTRSVRTARYNIPQVARQDAPATPAGLLPPLPAPVQLAGN